MANIERKKVVVKKEGGLLTATHPDHERFKMQRVIPKKLLDHELLKFIDCMV